MAERSKAAVLKTVDRKVRGFESLSLRQFFNAAIPSQLAAKSLHSTHLQANWNLVLRHA